MKHLKMVATVATVAMAAFAVIGAGSASATTLEVNGVAKNEAITIVGSLASGTSVVITDTSGAFANTCRVFEISGTAVSPFTASRVTGSGKTLKFGSCTHETVTAHKTGTLIGEHIPGTTNATMFSNGAEVTAPVTLGSSIITVNCKTSMTDIGVLTGTATGHATLQINAVINCGFFLPSAKMQATATVTSPTGVGATA
jgi:hypothetical protein